VFFTSTLYLTVAQAASVPTTPLVVVAVLGASVDVTVTELDELGPKSEVVLRDEWPDALTVSITVAFSPWTAVKVHVPVPPGAIGAGGQLTLVALPTDPSASRASEQAAGTILPYALSRDLVNNDIVAGNV
jgi:hypothetical protein